MGSSRRRCALLGGLEERDPGLPQYLFAARYSGASVARDETWALQGFVVASSSGRQVGGKSRALARFAARHFDLARMNIFRVSADLLHLMSILVLLLKIHATKSCAGISLKTQELYLAVFVTRYLDLFWNFHSLYNSVFKVVYIGTSAMIIWYMRRHRSVKQTYDKDHDTFRYLFLVAPCALTALVINQKFTIFEILWAFSIYLEAVAILPQLVLLQRTKNVDNLTGNYVFLLGMYRTFYILNWIYRYITEPHYSAWIVWVSGLVQTALYLDFFYYYLDAWKQSKKLQLPS